jgi:CHAT domain-containing protein
LAAGDLLYLAAATPEARRAELREVRDLPARLSYALSQTAIPGYDAPLREATLTLEQNRARWLSGTLALRSERPEGIPDDVWQAFATHREQIGQLQAEARLPEDTPSKRDFLTLTQELRAAYTALDQAVDTIRRQAPDFVPTSTFDDIRAALSPLPQAGEPVLGKAEGGPAVRDLVYLAVTSARTVALVVTPAAVYPVHTDLTEDALLEQIRGPADGPELGGYLGAYARWLSAHRAERDAARQAWFAALDHTTRWLWDSLMAPIVQTLTDLDVTHSTLIPSGWLAFLPLHAAWTDTRPPEGSKPSGGSGHRRYAMDDVCFSYAPSARALAHARAVAAAAPGTRLFAVDNPDSSLVFSGQEIDGIAPHFSEIGQEPWIVRGDRATRNTVLHALPQCDVYHFSCHGSNAWNAPLESTLWMYGHPRPLPLTVRDLLEQPGTQARLAFLSACETGLVGAALPDEVVGLASGFLQAGAAGVVSTLWAVNELSTALLAERFYAHWKGDGMEPPEALAAAQRWLRDQSDDGDWSHPYHWAGFILVGV